MSIAHAVSATQGRPADEPRSGWWDAPFRVFQTNLREIDANLDVEVTLDDIQAHGADTWLLNVGGILSHYPTDLPFQTRNPHLADRPGGDLVADALGATRRRGMRLLGRMDFSKVTGRIAQAHPEWLYRGPDGAPQVYEGLVSVCPRGEYYQERILDVLDEVLARYELDGFFFNWFGFNEVDYGGVMRGVCHCAACLDVWGAVHPDRPLPKRAGDDGYAEWKRLAAITIDELTARVAAHISARRAEVALILGRAADVLFHEANNAVGRELWPFATGDAVSALRVSQPAKPVMVNAVAFIDMPYRMASEQPEMMAQYLLQAIARGANPSTYIMGPTRRIAYASLEAAARVTRLHRDHRDVYTGLQPAARVGVVRPDPLAHPSARAAHARREYEGVCSALRENHIPFEVVASDALGALPPDRFDVLVLPDTAALDDGWIDAFAARGGRVLATGGSGLSAEGAPAPWHPAERVVAVVDDAEALKSSYVQTSPAPAVEGSDLIPLYGTAYDVEWAGDARTWQPVIEAAPYGPPEKAHGHVAGTRAAVAEREHGAGRVTAVAWTPGRAYAELGLTAVRDALAALVRDALGSAQLEVDAPDSLEVVLGRSEGGLVLHLINHSGQRRNSFAPAAPMHDVQLRLPGLAGASARSLVAPERTEVRQDGADLLISISVVGEAEVIVVSGEGGDGLRG